MFELCHAGRVASMALRDGGMIMEAWAVTVHGKATRSRIENILIAETAKRDLEGCTGQRHKQRQKADYDIELYTDNNAKR